jgi:hypothetical protein
MFSNLKIRIEFMKACTSVKAEQLTNNNIDDSVGTENTHHMFTVCLLKDALRFVVSSPIYA